MPRRRSAKQRRKKTGEWWSELKYGEAILRGLKRFEEEQTGGKKPTAGASIEAHTTRNSAQR